MQDLIPRGTGNSRWMKSSIPTGTTWEEALAMLRAGTFPFDLNGINSAGVAQMGTLLNKASLFSGETEAKYPAGIDTPDKAFMKLTEAAFVKDGSVVDMSGNVLGSKIATGSYWGTDKYGSSNANSLTFDFAPKFVWIHTYKASLGGQDRNVITTCVLSPDASYPSSLSYLNSYFQSETSALSYVSWSNGNKTVRWYASNKVDQLNADAKYWYIAWG